MQKGFTIIELMLVVAVMAVLAGVALPAFTDMINNNRRVTVVNDFLSTMHIARSEAITRNQRVTVCRASSPAHTACAGSTGGLRDGWIAFTDANGNGVIDGDDDVLATGGPIRGNLNVFSAQARSHLTFQPSGRVRASTGDNFSELMLCETGEATAARVIIINRTGRPRSDWEDMGGSPGECPA